MRKKGFTLIELIIVIAIIGILAGILIPSWGYYMQRARTRSQNLKAKTVFNAAQSVVTDMKFSERRKMNEYLDAAKPEDKSDIATKFIYGDILADNTTEWYYYWNGSTGIVTKTDGTAFTDTEIKKWNSTKSQWNTKIASSINKIINEDELVYRIYVKNYQVMSVVCARSANDRYLGTYPTTLDELEDKGKNVNSIREGKILGANMTQFMINPPAEDSEESGS